MVISYSPYLFFNGQCEEALKFYATALKGEIKSIMKVSDGPKEYQKPELMNFVMHSEFVVGKVNILASDSMNHPVDSGSNNSICLNFDDAVEIAGAFKALSEGGTVTMELQDTFWGAKFGTLKDKFGIHWMFNCEKK